MSDYLRPERLQCNSLASDFDNGCGGAWQPGGAEARRLVRRLNIPTPTAILIVEAAGINESAEV
jgi:hypothetical protein